LFLKEIEPFSYERLGRETEQHLNCLAEQGDSKARVILENIANLKKQSNRIVDEVSRDSNTKVNGEISALMPYFGALPKSYLAVGRAIRYSAEKGLTSNVLSTAIRHHLYEEVLYDTNRPSQDSPVVHERYPAKV